MTTRCTPPQTDVIFFVIELNRRRASRARVEYFPVTNNIGSAPRDSKTDGTKRNPTCDIDWSKGRENFRNGFRTLRKSRLFAHRSPRDVGHSSDQQKKSGMEPTRTSPEGQYDRSAEMMMLNSRRRRTFRISSKNALDRGFLKSKKGGSGKSSLQR